MDGYTYSQGCGWKRLGKLHRTQQINLQFDDEYPSLVSGIDNNRYKCMPTCNKRRRMDECAQPSPPALDTRTASDSQPFGDFADFKKFGYV